MGADAAAQLAASSDALAAVGVAVVTAGLVFAALLAAGFVMLVRRSRRRSAPDDSAVRAGVALVRLDDRVAEAEDELGFAAAQFGEERAAPLAVALAAARSSLTAAFRLQHVANVGVRPLRSACPAS